MGYAKWSGQEYNQLRARYANQSRDDIFQNNRLGQVSEFMNPYGLRVRESRDSEAHPNSIAIGLFLDVTGSMGRVPELLIRQKLGNLMDTLLDHGIQDPQVMFSAIGDQYTDRAPLQVGQFESGAIEMNQCLSQIYLEGGGGGQARESYQLAWLIGSRHTAIDCFEKRGEKGFLFTVGDEMSWDKVEGPLLQDVLGYQGASHLSGKALLAEAQKMYHVYHIHINETAYRNNPNVINFWKGLLGEHFLILNDHSYLAELIASVIAMVKGIDLDELTGQFDTNAAQTIRGSLQKIRHKTHPKQNKSRQLWF